MINKGLFTSTTGNWSTPQDFFDKLNAEFHFTLDVCADATNHKCAKYYTKEQDGLKQDWRGEVCFCNPVYGRGIGAWIKKCAEAGTLVVALLPARTDTKAFHTYIYGKDGVEIRFVKGRLKFGGSKNSAPFPSMVCVFRPKEAQ